MNRPPALRDAPCALFAEDRAQMSFGERAALEGLLSQLRPEIAVEVGTAEGGSLAYLAKHSGSVHSFDLDLPDEYWSHNVTHHTGDSHDLLPRVLASLAAHNRHVGFALIDGEHTPGGVRRDLLDVLESPAAAATLMLVHDSAQPLVRSGIEAVLGHAALVYYDLDFVPGRVFAEGPFAGERWGGFALLITGDRVSGHAPAQTLYR